MYFRAKKSSKNQAKHKQLPPQFHFATLTDDNYIILVQNLVKRETILPG